MWLRRIKRWFMMALAAGLLMLSMLACDTDNGSNVQIDTGSEDTTKPPRDND